MALYRKTNLENGKVLEEKQMSWKFAEDTNKTTPWPLRWLRNGTNWEKEAQARAPIPQNKQDAESVARIREKLASGESDIKTDPGPEGTPGVAEPITKKAPPAEEGAEGTSEVNVDLLEAMNQFDDGGDDEGAPKGD